MTSKAFKATIVRDGSMCFIPLTFDPKSLFGKVRAPVKVTLNGYTYRSTIAAMGGPPCIPLRKSNREAAGLDVIDPHLHSMQWSRRFTGLKVFLSLLAAGWDGYAEAIRHQTSMGSLLRRQLAESDWIIENDTELPVVCFSDPAGADPHAIVMRIVSSGEAWISTTVVHGKTVIRACITNYRTQPEDVAALVELLNAARTA